MDFYNNNRDRIEIFWGKDKKNWNLSQLDQFFTNKTVYITFDVDGFDSSIMPATGTPEPGGYLWRDFAAIIDVIKSHNLIGADVVELSPKLDNTGISSILAAKVIRSLIMLLDK